MKPFYTISVLTRDEFKSSMSSMINSMLAIIYALLALSIIIAIFGIVNTLALNVSERTKEIGLLRAIGTSNGQVRGMLAIEAVILSVFGTLVGIVVGVAAGVVIRIAYESQGMTTLTIPWDQLVLFLIVAILVGLIASISPARRALKHPCSTQSPASDGNPVSSGWARSIARLAGPSRYMHSPKAMARCLRSVACWEGIVFGKERE